MLNENLNFIESLTLMGGDLGQTGGDGSPQNLKWGTAHVSVLANILRSTDTGCESKHELTKKRCQGGTFCLKSRCLVKILVKKRVIYIYIYIYICIYMY